MRTEEQVRHVLDKTTEVLKETKGRLHDIQAWMDASVNQQSKELLLAQDKEKADITKRIYGLEKQIDAYKYVLEIR